MFFLIIFTDSTFPKSKILLLIGNRPFNAINLQTHELQAVNHLQRIIGNFNPLLDTFYP